MENKLEELELRGKYPEIFEKIDRVIFESRKYNLIDRYFHFSIESDALLKYIISLNLDIKLGSKLNNFRGLLDLERGFIIENIIDCYGLHPIDSHENSERLMLINNPQLLGISPILFGQKLWTKVIISDIGKSNYKVDDVNDLYDIIKNCLNETLERLGRKDFDGLKHHGYGIGWDKEILTPSDISTLVVDDIYDLDKNPKSTENIIKNLIKENSEAQSSRITLIGQLTTGVLSQKIIAKFNKEKVELNGINESDIKSFVSQNFQNSKGKKSVFKTIKNRRFFINNMKHIGLIMNVLEEHFNNNNVARALNKTFPELGEVSTIKNFSSIKLIKGY